MQFKVLIASALLATASAQFNNGTRLCGTPHPTEQQMAESRAMLEKERIALAKGEGRALAGFTVNTYFHVVASSNSLSGGYLTVWNPPNQPLFPEPTMPEEAECRRGSK